MIAALAYRFARRHADDPRFSFGTGKLGELAGFASAVILGVVALMIGYESAMRLLDPVRIDFDLAIAIAVAGLLVNLVSAWLLFDEGHHHHHDEAHEHPHHHHGDHNAQAAYFHVLADALTSVLAIVALLAGRFYGWVWLDPLAGVLGALVIAHWSFGLLRSSGAVLLDVMPGSAMADAVRSRLEVGDDRVCDLHLWRLGPGHAAVIVSVVTHDPQPASLYKVRLAGIEGLSHVTVEVNHCPDHP
jgi:cation diffusion facilitator family transporter